MFGKKKKLPIDVDQVIAGAVEAAFGDTNRGTRNGDARQGGSDSGHDHRLGGVAAVAAGIVIAGAARAVYKRARELSLEQVAEKAEQRLQNSAS
jgi:hypothetical protein